MFLIQFVNEIDRFQYAGIRMGLSVIGMLFSIGVLIKVSFCNMYTPDPNRLYDFDGIAMVVWF
jgi:hypothetical protein